MLYILLIALGVGLDQLVKFLCVQLLKPVGTVAVLPGLLNFTYVENTGAAFGMLSGFRWLFVSVAALAAIVIVVLIVRRVWTDRLMLWGLALVASGALGNMTDRAINGYVVDFAELAFMRFGIFNVADMILTAGVILLVLHVIKTETRRAPEHKESPNRPTDGDVSDSGGEQQADVSPEEPPLANFGDAASTGADDGHEHS